MSDFWLLVLALALTSFIPRASFILLFARWPVPAPLQRALRYVPAAVLAALVVPALVRSGGAVDLSPDNLRLVAGILAAVAAWFTRNVLLTLGVGMGALWTLQWLA